MITRIGELLLVVVATALSLVFTELALRALAPIQDPLLLYKRRPDVGQTVLRSSFPADLRLQLRTEAGLPGMSTAATTFSTNNVGLRGDHLPLRKSAEEFRVFVVGGSTTECLYLDDTVTLTRVLQNRLNALAGGGAREIKVYGAGKSGARTHDHVEMIAHRLVHLQPDLIVVFTGINDLRAAMNGGDHLFLPPREGPATRWALDDLAKLAATEFQVGRRVFALLRPDDYQSAILNITLTSDYRRAVGHRRALPPTMAPPHTAVPPYRDNLQSMLGVARSHGVPLVFMTQATSWNSPEPEMEQWHWMSASRDSAYAGDRLDAAMESYNDAMRSVASAGAVPLFDLARELPKSGRYMYDDVHFNIAGARVTADLLARFLVDRGLVAGEAPRGAARASE